MGKQKFTNQSQFAEYCKVSRNAISKGIKANLVHRDKQGIDIYHPANIEYRKNTKFKGGNQLRSISAKRAESGNKTVKSVNDKPGMVPVKVGGLMVDVPSAEFEDTEGMNEVAIAARYLVARTSKIEQEDLKLKLQNARLRGEVLDREAVYSSLFLYLDKLHSNLERFAGAFLKDVGFQIINAEEVTPAINQQFIDEILKQIDMTKNTVVKNLKKIAKNQR